jgi:hypothetical protein
MQKPFAIIEMKGEKEYEIKTNLDSKYNTMTTF